ncbi:hypothetical protein O1M54_50865 [Streptomyces diastatochromogenes]|nr:hypothetical protein [Streptomyces diastatochromogenes]MCZ0991789.1 hypothetical protein [Streptomyces diastatochromogenes]
MAVMLPYLPSPVAGISITASSAGRIEAQPSAEKAAIDHIRAVLALLEPVHHGPVVI